MEIVLLLHDNQDMIEILLLGVFLPGATTPILGGGVVVDLVSGDFDVVFRVDWHGLCDPEDEEVLSGMLDTLRAMGDHRKPGEFMAVLEETLSNSIRCIERITVPSDIPVNTRAQRLKVALIDRN